MGKQLPPDNRDADAGNEKPPYIAPKNEDGELVYTIPSDEVVYEFDPDDSNLVQHAMNELNRAGIGDEDADYGGDLYDAVLELVTLFASQGHSGGSAYAVIEMFSKLARFEPLTDITSDPDEWTYVHDDEDGKPQYQNKRRSSSFSRDGGKTWYDIQDHTLNNGDAWFPKDPTRDLQRDWQDWEDEGVSESK